MSQTSTANESLRSARRSTRIDQSIPLTIIGVDSARGPYREDVATVTISGHGCKYESKYDVLHGSVVILELNGHKPGSPSNTARGRVKWAKRPGIPGGMYETAIELDEPGNIWGVDSPPQDWLNAVKTQAHQAEAPKTKPFAVARPEPVSTANLSAREASLAGRDIRSRYRHQIFEWRRRSSRQRINARFPATDGVNTD